MLYARYLCSRDALGRPSAARDDRVSCIYTSKNGDFWMTQAKASCSSNQMHFAYTRNLRRETTARARAKSGAG